MSTQHWKGPTIPEAGDDLLEAFPEFASSAGLYIPVSSVAAARAKVAAAPAGLITSTTPAVFLIKGTLYWSDGSVNSSGTVTMHGVNKTNGILAENNLSMDGTGDSNAANWYNEQEVSFTITDDRLLEFRFMACISTEDDSSDTARAGWYMAFRLDGDDKLGTEIGLDRTWATKQLSYTLAVTAGTHTASIRSHSTFGGAPWFHYSPASGSGNTQSIGRRFQIIDLGVVS